MPGGFQGEWPADAEEGFEPARTDFPEGEMPEMFGGEMPEDFDPSQMPQFPGGQELPEGFDSSQMGGGPGQRPEGMEDMTLPESFDDMELPEGFEGEMPAMPEGGFGGGSTAGEASTGFYMSDQVNAFSGVTPAES